MESGKWAIGLAALLVACGGKGAAPGGVGEGTTAAAPGAAKGGMSETNQGGGDTVSSMTITSTAFANEGEIPAKHTCQGDDVSVPLNWSGVPSEAKSLALISDDPDAPDPKAPKMVWVHWVLYNLPSSATGLEEAVSSLPEGTMEGKNDWKRTGYGGPCPPIGRHRYYFKLYALDTVLDDLGEPTKDELVKAMAGHIIAEAELMGTYQKR
jgi:Raf kinase inhibitor-like YbhB/YbcL family protein